MDTAITASDSCRRYSPVVSLLGSTEVPAILAPSVASRLALARNLAWQLQDGALKARYLLREWSVMS